MAASRMAVLTVERRAIKAIELILWPALIVLITFVVYIPSMHGGFVWDDVTYIASNPIVKAADGLHRFWVTTEAFDYYPLTWTVWWLEWRLWGENTVGYHLVSIVLHIDRKSTRLNSSHRL